MVVCGCRPIDGTPRAGGGEAPAIVVNDDFRERSIGLDLDLMEDSAGALTIADIRSPANASRFRPSAKAAPNFGYTKSAVWARFAIDDLRSPSNPASHDALALTLAYALTDTVELWCTDRGGAEVVHGRAGDHVRRAEWPSTHRDPTFLLPPSARNCHVRVDSRDATQFPLTLRTREAFASYRLTDAVTQCLYFGAVLVMFAYNALVAAATRSRAYAWYALFLVSQGLTQGTLIGAGYAFLWTDAIGWADRAAPLWIAAIGVTSILFASELLDLERAAPKLGMLSRATLSYLAGYAAFMGFFPTHIATLAVLAVAPLWGIVLLGGGVVLAWEGIPLAKLYLLAWSIFVVGSVVTVATNLGIVPMNVFTVNAPQVGSAVEFVLLSFALADRIKQLQAEATANAERAREATVRLLEEQERTNAELQRMDKLKDAFLANTSHELRTPLNGILGLVETTLDGAVGAVPAPVKRNLELVRASGRRLATLVNDILDFSKLHEKSVMLREKPVALQGVVELTLQTLAPLAADKDVRLVNEVPEVVGVRADENRLQQILTNLVGNAIKFTHEGHVAVRAVRRDGRVFVSVQDTGIGIPKDAQGRIFESFEQGDGSTGREYGGTGLGLTVTKQLVELHGGCVVVESEPGAGSTFTFDLAADTLPEPIPAARVARASAPSTANIEAGEAPLSTHAAPQGLRVLVVDDEPVNREVLAQHLVSRGFEVLQASDGVQAIARIEADRPDVVLLDVMMPKKTGYDVLEEVRPKLDAEQLPVLLLTAKAQESDLKHGFGLGASDYLLKPVSFVELDARLGHHARLVRAVRALSVELEERRRLQGELDLATQRLTQAENMATLGMLMAGIAHDLRNPLNYVQGAAERIRAALPHLRSEDGALRDKNIALLEKVVGWVDQGTASMNAISLAMRNQARGGGAQIVDVNLREVVTESLLLCRSRTRVCEVEVDVADEIIRADATALGQLVMNLVSNAADAILEVRAKDADYPTKIRVSAQIVGGRFQIAVEDSGPGIPEHVRALILEPFFTTKPRGQGTGLGLAIVQRVVKQHGGTLEVGKSQALGGASFRVEWSP